MAGEFWVEGVLKKVLICRGCVDFFWKNPFKVAQNSFQHFHLNGLL